MNNKIESITCLRCGKTSWSRGDIDNLYCGDCGWHSRGTYKLNCKEGVDERLKPFLDDLAKMLVKDRFKNES